MKKGPNQPSQPPPPITPEFNKVARNTPPAPVTPKFNDVARKPPTPPPPAGPNGPGPRNPPGPITPKFNEVARNTQPVAPPKANSSGLRNPPLPITPEFNKVAMKNLQKKQDAHDLTHKPPGASNRSPERQAKIDALAKQVNQRLSRRLKNGPKLG